MDPEDDDLPLEQDPGHEIEIEEPEGEEDAGDGYEDGQSQEASGPADGDRQEAPQGQIRAPSRAERRVEAALRESREAKAELQRLRDEIAQARRAPAETQETPAQRAERLSMMDPDQRVEYLLNEQERRMEQRLAAQEFRANEAADKSAFASLCAGNSVAAKYADQVEERLAEMRRAGTTAPRETVLAYIIGLNTLRKAPAAATRAGTRAATNRAAQAVRPPSSRGDAGGGGGRADDRTARAKRLEDVQI